MLVISLFTNNSTCCTSFVPCVWRMCYTFLLHLLLPGACTGTPGSCESLCKPYCTMHCTYCRTHGRNPLEDQNEKAATFQGKILDGNLPFVVVENAAVHLLQPQLYCRASRRLCRQPGLDPITQRHWKGGWATGGRRGRKITCRSWNISHVNGLTMDDQSQGPLIGFLFHLPARGAGHLSV